MCCCASAHSQGSSATLKCEFHRKTCFGKNGSFYTGGPFYPGCNVADEYLSILECLLIFCNYWAWNNVHVHSYTLSYDLLTTFVFFCVMMFHGVFFYQLIYLLYILCGLPLLLSKATGSRSLRGWEEITRGFVCFFVRGRPLRPSSVMISYTLSVSPVAVESIIEV